MSYYPKGLASQLDGRTASITISGGPGSRRLDTVGQFATDRLDEPAAGITISGSPRGRRLDTVG